MKKLILFLMIIFLNVGIANAKGLPNSFDNAFSETGLSKHVVSISIQDIDKPKKLYELNYEKPMIPASTQKLITCISHCSRPFFQLTAFSHFGYFSCQHISNFTHSVYSDS